MGVNCYVLQHDLSDLFMVSTMTESLLLSSKDKKMIQKLLVAIQQHEKEHQTWLSKCRLRTKRELYLCESKSLNSNSVQSAKMEIKELDTLDPKIQMDIQTMYQIHNVKLFLMDKIDYDDTQQLLCISGIIPDMPHAFDEIEASLYTRTFLGRLVNKAS
jgi:hypothetical protein